jgi:hypothetical protein
MATRLPASHRTREDLTSLIEGRLSTGSAKDELVKLATRLIVEEALEGEAGDAVGRDYYAHGAQPTRAERTRTFSLCGRWDARNPRQTRGKKPPDQICSEIKGLTGRGGRTRT